MNYKICLITVFLQWTVATTSNDPLLVQLPFGTLRGRDDGAYYSYEGIPYAEPPLGKLRFEPPQTYRQKWCGVLDASPQPKLCMQWDQLTNGTDKLVGVEDCLTLSIFKPKSSKRRSFAVLVHIHGGAFMFGGSNKAPRPSFMENGSFILVSIRYRLGPLGFLSSEDASLSGNMGLKDQRMALKWIKQHIVHFGGEPEHIVWMGFSAGGASVHLQLLQADAQRLAKVAFSMSGNALDPWVMQQSARFKAFELARIVGCGKLGSSAQLKRCLQQQPAEKIVRAVAQLQVFDYVPFNVFGVVVESKQAPAAFLTQHPRDIMNRTCAIKLPWLVSYANEDGAYNAAALMQRDANGVELIEQLNNRWFELAPHLLFYRQPGLSVKQMDAKSLQLRDQYMGQQNFSRQSYLDMQRMFTDVLFKRSIEQVTKLHRKHCKSPLYIYNYNIPTDLGAGVILSKRTDIAFGASHAADYLLTVDASARPLRAAEIIVSRKLKTMLEQFVYSKQSSLSYANCALPNNVGRQLFQLVSIRNSSCSIQQVKQLP
ncbi:maker711 [Drosophila busckii]|uniref:carboxylesterase n=1 Tax=Drosophila busckii TaxID=30019 RepID=A0A0M4EPM6_DROBS|nr:esterase-5B [Drosophila busckii]ALC44092.1 maker711 [Drosophila busckii]